MDFNQKYDDNHSQKVFNVGKVQLPVEISAMSLSSPCKRFSA